MTSAIYFGYFVGNVVAGAIGDARGRRPTILAMATLAAFFSFISSLFSFNIYFLLVTRSIFAAGIGGLLPITYS